jgi:hypothetical protein
MKEFGCNHMFCTKCKTTFDWATGKATRGPSTNPHYAEYLRELAANARGVGGGATTGVGGGGAQPRTQGDVPCGELPPLKEMVAFMKNRDISSNKLEYKEIHECVKKCMEYLSRPSHRPELEFEDLRMKHVVGILNDAQFKTQVFNRELSNAKKFEISQIIDAFVTISNERLVNLYSHFQHTKYNRNPYDKDLYPETIFEIQTVRQKLGEELGKYLPKNRNPILKDHS